METFIKKASLIQYTDGRKKLITKQLTLMTSSTSEKIANSLKIQAMRSLHIHTLS